MTLEQITAYCLQKKEVSEHLPFDNHTLVYKVFNKMFLLVSLKKWEQGEFAINVKTDPEYSEELRSTYASIRPGYHMNKKHWNTLYLYDNELTWQKVSSLIDHSYDMVKKTLPKYKQKLLE